MTISYDDALTRVLAKAPALGTESVGLEEALGRVLAENVCAASPLPAFDHGAMDGYAVDTGSFGGSAPFEFRVSGESRTGKVPPALLPGTACRIFTGAPMPAGADAVIPQEDAERSGDVVSFASRPMSFAHVRRRGEDLERGVIALESGTRLGAYQLGLLAAVDRASVVVARRPRVTLLSTGDELRPSGAPGHPASIPESNGIVVRALASEAGAAIVGRVFAHDELAGTLRAVTDSLDACDLLVTIGGVSAGDYDVVRPALEVAGVVLDFCRVAIKPGKPLTFGNRGDTVVLGLPGNPMSAQVTFSLFGVPLLRRMQGENRVMPSPWRLRLGAPIRQKHGRRGYYAATVSGEVATPLAGNQSSGSAVSLARAEALVIVPEDSDGIAEGEWVDALSLRCS